MSPEKSERVRNMIEAGASTKEICRDCNVVPAQVYNQKMKVKKESGAEPEEGEEVATKVIDEDFWKVRYLEAHALLVENGIVE
jgi:transposase-like protein